MKGCSPSSPHTTLPQTSHCGTLHALMHFSTFWLAVVTCVPHRCIAVCPCSPRKFLHLVVKENLVELIAPQPKMITDSALSLAVWPAT